MPFDEKMEIECPHDLEGRTALEQMLADMGKVKEPSAEQQYCRAMLAKLLEKGHLRRQNVLNVAGQKAPIHQSVGVVEEYDQDTVGRAWSRIVQVVDGVLAVIVRPQVGTEQYKLLVSDRDEAGRGDCYGVCKKLVARAVLEHGELDRRKAGGDLIKQAADECRRLRVGFIGEHLNAAFRVVRTHAYLGDAPTPEPPFVPPPPTPPPPPVREKREPLTLPAALPVAPAPPPTAPSTTDKTEVKLPKNERVLDIIAYLRWEAREAAQPDRLGDVPFQDGVALTRELLLDYMVTGEFSHPGWHNESFPIRVRDAKGIAERTFTPAFGLADLGSPGGTGAPAAVNPDVTLPSDPQSVLEVVNEYRAIRGHHVQGNRGRTRGVDSDRNFKLRSLEDLLCLGRTRFDEQLAELGAGAGGRAGIESAMRDVRDIVRGLEEGHYL